MKPIEIHQSTLISLPSEILWKYLADTDDLNKNIGLPSVSFVPLSEPEKRGYYHAVVKFMGLNIKYDELPFDFVTGDYYEVTRQFRNGPFKVVKGGIRLEEENGGTRIDVYTVVTPRNLIGYIIVKTVLKRKATRDIVGYIKHLEEQFQSKNDIDSITPLIPPKINNDNLKNRLKTLSDYPVSEYLISKLEIYLKNSSDLAVTHIRPFELAYQWRQDPMDILRFCLYAAKAGVLDLVWNVLCPNCGAGTQDGSNFFDLQAGSHCTTCQINFGVDFAKSVEAVFRVHNSIRDAHKVIYCIGGPANMPQILAQFRVQPNGNRNEKVAFKCGTIRIRSYHFKEIIPRFVTNDLQARSSLKINATPKGLVVEQADLKEGDIQIEIKNELDHEILVVLEHENYLKKTATAAQVITLQEFRELFPNVAVSPGVQIAFSDLVLLFTDLKDSTALYETVGDSKGFEFVQKHFTFLTEIVRKNNGSIVKTMGDSIMSSFINPGDAFQAALDMQLEWNSFIQNGFSDINVKLKIGLHKGTAFAINDNDNHDYFGSMVNETSRIETKSKGGDIVFSKEILNDPGVKSILSSNTLTPEPFTTQLKGLVKDRTLYQVQILV